MGMLRAVQRNKRKKITRNRIMIVQAGSHRQGKHCIIS